MPATARLTPSPGSGPLVLLVASTAHSGRTGVLAAALQGLAEVRLAAPQLTEYAGALPPWAVAGPGRLVDP